MAVFHLILFCLLALGYTQDDSRESDSDEVEVTYIDATDALARRVTKQDCRYQSNCMSIPNSKCQKVRNECRFSNCICNEGYSFVKSVNACAPATARMNQTCGVYAGCKQPFSVCSLGACTCQLGYRWKDSRCVLINTRRGRCEGGVWQKFIENGVSFKKFVCPGRGIKRKTRQLSEACGDDIVCEGENPLCVQCSQSSTRRICTTPLVDKAVNKSKETTPETAEQVIIWELNYTKLGKFIDSQKALDRMQYCYEIGEKTFNNNPPYCYSLYYSACVPCSDPNGSDVSHAANHVVFFGITLVVIAVAGTT